MNEKISEPSYVMSAVGGFFLGILGAAVVMMYSEHQWVFSAIPVACLLAALLGTYVAAEPYDDLRQNYDKLVDDAAALVKKSEAKPGVDAAVLDEILARWDAQGARLLAAAQEAGADGIKLAEAAETMRKEANNLRKLKEMK